LKLCLVCSHGGHFTEMAHLFGAFEHHDYFIVTYESEATKNLKKSYLLRFEGWDLKGKILHIKSIIKSAQILIEERPNVIITTGGGEIAVPFCYFGKILGCKIIFIETLARVSTPSGGGKLIYPISDLFLVQWQSLLKKYGCNAKYWGKII
jgi:beta-1,4-N-acetylglucosaminyltransferase